VRTSWIWCWSGNYYTAPVHFIQKLILNLYSQVVTYDLTSIYWRNSGISLWLSGLVCIIELKIYAIVAPAGQISNKLPDKGSYPELQGLSLGCGAHNAIPINRLTLGFLKVCWPDRTNLDDLTNTRIYSVITLRPANVLQDANYL